jgi:hypothetical protein
VTAVRHLVAFRVPDPANLDELLRLLETMKTMDGVRSHQVERDLGLHPPAYDVLLITEHDSEGALAAFRADPRHTAVAKQLSEISDSRVTIDHPLEV